MALYLIEEKKALVMYSKYIYVFHIYIYVFHIYIYVFHIYVVKANRSLTVFFHSIISELSFFLNFFLPLSN